MGALLSFLFPSSYCEDMDMPIYEYDFHEEKENGFFANDIIMIHPCIPRLTWIKVVDEAEQGPESFLRVVPLSVFTYRNDPTLDPEHYDSLNDLGDTVLEDNRLYILVPDFRPSILESLGLSFLSPYTYSETQVVQCLTATYEALINAALNTTYKCIRFSPLSINFAGPWLEAKASVKLDGCQNGYDYHDMAKFTAQALATACSHKRLAMIHEQGKTFEIVLTAEEKEAFSKMIQALT